MTIKKYSYTKTVMAGKITEVIFSKKPTVELRIDNGTFDADRDWLAKYQPHIGGYLLYEVGSNDAEFMAAHEFELKYKEVPTTTKD